MFFFQVLPTTFSLTSADINAPEYKNNGWWNTTAESGKDWVINTTNNLWVNKNITAFNSILINNSGSLIFQNCTVIVYNKIIVKNNGSLTLINTTLKFNGTGNGSSELRVLPGGSLYIRDYDDDPNTIGDRSNITCNIADNKQKNSKN